jgi:hypothetical protein
LITTRHYIASTFLAQDAPTRRHAAAAARLGGATVVGERRSGFPLCEWKEPLCGFHLGKWDLGLELELQYGKDLDSNMCFDISFF